MIALAPLPGQLVFTISPNMGFMILEQRLGGKMEGKFVDRPLTDIDQSLLRGLVEHMIGDIKAAWSKVVTVEPSLEDFHHQPALGADDDRQRTRDAADL
jgi:flagellar motor switch protein FliM